MAEPDASAELTQTLLDRGGRRPDVDAVSVGRPPHDGRVSEGSASSVALSARGSSGSASGFPRVSATIRSRTWSSSLNRTTEPSNSRAPRLRKIGDSEIRQLPELVPRIARREHEPDSLGEQTTRDERECERRALIDPMGIVDQTKNRTVVGRGRQHARKP